MRLLAGNCLVSAVIFALGDVLSQTIEHRVKHKDWDQRRLASMCLFGGLVRGPVLYLWFTKGLTRWFPSRSLNDLLPKLALDQLLFGPTFMAVFFVTITLANGGNWQDAQRKLQREFVPTLIRGWALWPSVQLVNFCLVPAHYQLMAINGVAVGWMGYLSYVEFRSKMHLKAA